jgi:hypothetical protein
MTDKKDCSGFFFFFFGNKHSIKANRSLQPLKEERKQKVVQDYNKKSKEKGGGKNGNATRENSCRGPICKMMGAEVCTSVNLLSLPLRRGREEEKLKCL